MQTHVSLQQTWSDFPALELVRTGRMVKAAARWTLISLMVAAMAMIFVPWQQTAPGTGVVVALDPQQRPQPVRAAVKGVVSYVKPGLREGSYVEKDELLLSLTPISEREAEQIELQILAVEAKRTASETNLAVYRQGAELQVSSGRSLADSLDRELMAAGQKYEQAKTEEAALRAELQDKENQSRIAEEVITRGLISREELVSKRQAAEVQYQKVKKAESAVLEAFSTLEAKEEEIKSKKQEIDIKNQTAQTKVLEEEGKLNTILKELSELQLKRGALDRLHVRAPRSGYIQQWFGLTGSDTVSETEQLFVIVPDASELCVELKINGNDIPLVKEGDRVRLQFEGWPAVQFIGWPSVAVGTFGGKINRIFPTDDGLGNFRVVVTPDDHFARESGWPDQRYLRQGARANAWVLLREVPLGYEIWRQLNGFPPVVATQEPKTEKAAKVNIPKP
jgi:multidrug resistance efflux pump